MDNQWLAGFLNLTFANNSRISMKYKDLNSELSPVQLNDYQEFFDLFLRDEKEKLTQFVRARRLG